MQPSAAGTPIGRRLYGEIVSRLTSTGLRLSAEFREALREFVETPDVQERASTNLDLAVSRAREFADNLAGAHGPDDSSMSVSTLEFIRSVLCPGFWPFC